MVWTVNEPAQMMEVSAVSPRISSGVLTGRRGLGSTVGRERDLDRYDQDMAEHADGAGWCVCDPPNRGLC